MLALWLVWGSAAAAEPDLEQETAPAPPGLLDPVVIAGTLIPTDLRRSPGDVTIITKEQIAAMRAVTAADALRHIPGLHIDQLANRGGMSSIYLRGGDPNYTLVLIDGVRVNDPTNSRGGSVDFSSLSVNGIERIEVARGVFSSVYGSDAMAGVVNIVTSRGTGPPESAVELSGGGLGDHRALVESQGAFDRLDYSISGAYVDGGQAVDGSQLIGATLQAGIGFHPTDRTELRYRLRYADSHQEAFPDDSGGPSYAVIRDLDNRDTDELTMGLTWSQEVSSSQEFSAALTYQARRELLDSPGVAPGVRDPFGIPPNVTETDYHLYAVTLSHLIEITNGAHVTVGLTAQTEEGDSAGSLLIGGMTVPTNFTMKRDLGATFVEARYEPGKRLVFQAGARLDLPEGEATQASPRLGVIWIMPPAGATLRVTWGQGFKLPSFFALGHPIVGNPNLKLERSRSVDVAVAQSWLDERVTISGTIFFNRFRDAIDFQEGPPPMMVNRSLITANGAELAATLQATGTLTLLPHVSYVRTDIAGTAEELRSRPRWRGGMTVRWRPKPPVRLHADVLTVGRVHDSSIPTGDRALDAYTRVNLAATWRANATWELFVAIDNLLNARYEEAVGFTVRGITPRFGVRATL